MWSSTKMEAIWYNNRFFLEIVHFQVVIYHLGDIIDSEKGYNAMRYNVTLTGN